MFNPSVFDHIRVFWHKMLLCSACLFPTLQLELAMTLRNPRSLQWRMAFGKHNLGARALHCCWVILGSGHFRGQRPDKVFSLPRKVNSIQHSGLSWKWFIVWTVLDRQAGKENEHRFAWGQGSPDGCSCCLYRTLALWSYSWRSFSALLLPSWVFWDSQPQYSHQQNGNNYSIDHRGWLWGSKYIIAI